MAADRSEAARFSLRRWSRRKLAAGRGDDSRRPSADAPPPADPTAGTALPGASGNAALAGVADAPVPGASGAHEATTSGRPDAQRTPAAAASTGAADALPPIESLTSDSDFAPFLRPGVDEGVKRGALRKLFRDPRFNVMDGLDVYIDDYSKPSPLEPELVRTLMHARYIFDPPRTRVTAQGHVEDVPEEDAARDAEEAPPHALGAAAPQDAVPDADVHAPSDPGVPRDPGDR